jgi:hypothetical protein
MRWIVPIVVTGLGAAHVDKAGAALMNPHFRGASMAIAGSPGAGRVLGGMTAQQLPVVMTLSRNGRQMTARVALDMHCTSGNEWVAPDGWNRITVSSSGKVHAVGPVPPVAASSPDESAITGGLDDLEGTLNRQRATFSGSWELQLNFASPTGQSDSCDSGRVRFRVQL